MLWFAKPGMKFLLTAIFFWFFVFQISALSPFASISSSIALLLNAGLMLVFLTLRPIQSFLCGLPKPHLIVLVGLFFLFAAGHHLPGAKREVFFPFVQWDMFGRAEDASDVTYFEYEGVHADGSRVTLNPTRYFPPLRHARLSAAIWSRLRQQTKGREPGRPTKPLEELLKAVARAHNRAHPDRQVLQVDIVKSTMDLGTRGRPLAARTLVGRIVLRTPEDTR